MTIKLPDEAFLDNPRGKDFLTNITDMRDALRQRDVRGGTAMRNAIQMGVDWLKKAHKDKKVLVVVTDGEDNASDEEHNSLEKVVRSARQNEVLIYSVGLLSEEDHHAAAQEDPPEATGGFLAAALILAYRNATDRSQQAVEITHHLPHPDLIWRLHQDITPALPGYALDPALGFQVKHDMLQKALGNIIPLRQLPDRNGALFIMRHQRKHGS